MTSLLLLAFVVLPFLFVENMRSSMNIRRLKARGAIEAPDDPYAIMGIVYVGGFVAMAIEGWLRGGAPRPWLMVGLLVFTLAKLLKFWAVGSLGPFWSFRVFVLPGATLVSSGPYRYLRHPNYVAVIAEIIGCGLMVYGPIAGVVTLIAFSLILRTRIAVEERMLGLA
jgi:methyltransferase